MADFGADKLGAKIRNARLMRYPYIGVIGEKEATARAIAPRSREAGDLGALPLEAFADRLVEESTPPRIGPRAERPLIGRANRARMPLAAQVGLFWTTEHKNESHCRRARLSPRGMNKHE